MEYFISVIVLLIAAGVGYFAYLKFVRSNPEELLIQKRQQAEQLINKAKQEAQEFQKQLQQDLQNRQKRLIDLTEKHKVTEQKAEKNLEQLNQRWQSKDVYNQTLQANLAKEQAAISQLEAEVRQFKEDYLNRLAVHYGKSLDQLKDDLLGDLAEDLSLARQTRMARLEENLENQKVATARNLLVEAVYRYSDESSVEKKTSVIPVSREETKAKIIGKNAELIRLIEDKTGVNIIFEEGKKGILVTHYDLVRRHWAKETIIKLMRDKNLDLSKVMRRLKETAQEVKKQLVDIGDEVVKKLRLQHRQFPNEFKEILGRLKYRTSYGQNILRHCFEVGYFTLMIGNELNLNEEICKIGGFFHDLGKAIDQEDGRPHDVLTKEIMERFNFSWEEIHAAWTHHDSEPIRTPEALLVKAADALSAGRPGARQETLEKYLARIMALESIANSYQGVNKSYAISGGRELRILLDSKQVKDQAMPEMANQIAQEIENNVAYPGQIKVNVIRRINYYKTVKDKSKKAPTTSA